MLYYKFKDSKWIKAKSRNFAFMVYELSYFSSLAPFASFTKRETQEMVQIFSNKKINLITKICDFLFFEKNTGGGKCNEN